MVILVGAFPKMNSPCVASSLEDLALDWVFARERVISDPKVSFPAFKVWVSLSLVSWFM